ncbi:MAG: hypothetical protein AUJ98_04895 [Bacteroidetes bacterium CG2_30_33_31]|nr:MAG: hypothetical protein AUJ98_04895 [Bacteroidetes bacterium CG2_30_33_31]
MFVRQKKNRSGTTSVVVVTKSHGIFKELKTIGVSDDCIQIEKFINQAQQWIQHYKGELDVFQQSAKEQEERHLQNICYLTLKTC